MVFKISYVTVFFIFLFGCSTAQIRTDKEAQSAVGAISEAVTGMGSTVKYCPVTGKRYSPRIEVCPVHGVALEEVDN